MKIKNVYKVFFFIGGALLFLSLTGGPATLGNFEVTGAPGSFQQDSGQPGTCANSNCHGMGGAFDPTLTIELLDGMDVVTAYEPGNTYMLRITNTPGMGTPDRYGFQAVALDSTHAQAGQWGTLGTGQQEATLSGRSYVEHSAGLPTGTFEMEWIAPEGGTGEVTIYAASNAANGNGGAGGDGIASDSLKIEEMPPNSTFFEDKEIASLKIYPNPVHETLNLQINSRIAGNFNIRIMDISGKLASTAPINLSDGDQTIRIPVGDLAIGLYVVQLYGNDHLAAVQMIKE